MTDTGVMDLRITKPRIHMPDANIVNVSEKQQKQSLPFECDPSMRRYKKWKTPWVVHYKSSKKDHVLTIGKQDS
jgi:hypothetical protein